MFRFKHQEKMYLKNHYYVEIYALIKYADRSLIKLNPILKKFGYEIVLVNLKDLEANFSNLFLLPKSYNSKETVLIDGYTISGEFMQLVLDHSLFGHEILMDKEAIFIKRIKNFKQEINVDDKGFRSMNFQLSISAQEQCEKFVHHFIQQLRLHKNGDITSPLSFQITKKDRGITMKKSSKLLKPHSNSKYCIIDSDIKKIGNILKKDLKSNALTELAHSNFNLSYDISDAKTKFITLMTALESLFNFGEHQITHTVARHLSLIMSKDKDEFELNYGRIKKLYKIRSLIVHGHTPKENMQDLNDEMQDKVRQAIIYCQSLSITKEDLFTKLNCLGWQEAK